MFIRNDWDELTAQIFRRENREADSVLSPSRQRGQEQRVLWGDTCVCSSAEKHNKEITPRSQVVTGPVPRRRQGNVMEGYVVTGDAPVRVDSWKGLA